MIAQSFREGLSPRRDRRIRGQLTLGTLDLDDDEATPTRRGLFNDHRDLRRFRGLGNTMFTLIAHASQVVVHGRRDEVSPRPGYVFCSVVTAAQEQETRVAE